MGDLDIAQVARLSGVAASALRFYEEKKLIASIGRRGLRRLFGPNVLEQLRLIALGQAAGFSLQEIAALLGSAGRVRINRQMLQARADALDKMIADMRALQGALRHAAACPAPSHLECPKFRRLLRVAGAIRGVKAGQAVPRRAGQTVPSGPRRRPAA